MRVLHSTPFPSNFTWRWGHIRGGTPSVLITPPGAHGPKYLAFFHSQARPHHKGVKTYFMGAYLFSPDPPFAITHVTPEPLVPPGHMYNETELGWTYPNLDFVVFPMGLVLLDAATLALSLGVNDNRCYIVEMGLDALVNNMTRVG